MLILFRHNVQSNTIHYSSWIFTRNPCFTYLHSRGRRDDITVPEEAISILTAFAHTVQEWKAAVCSVWPLHVGIKIVHLHTFSISNLTKGYQDL
jgi:hypothetical protein